MQDLIPEKEQPKQTEPVSPPLEPIPQQEEPVVEDTPPVEEPVPKVYIIYTCFYF